MDIYFYDFNINCVHILPSSSKEIGYVSANAQIDFNSDGSFEIVYYDPELKELLKSYPDGLLLKWGKFDGIVTDWQCKNENEWRIYGTHLNAILHKEVVPGADEELSGNLKTIVQSKLSTYYPYIVFQNTSEIFENITFLRKDYKPGNTYMQDLISRGHAGYSITIDAANKQLCFTLLNSNVNPLMLSEANLNAYNFQEDYDGKTAATGGWYKQEQADDAGGNTVDPVWTYITSDSTKTGLNKQDVILSSTTETEAIAELAELTATHTLTCSTKNVEYDVDYKLGDKIRVLNDNICVQKTIISIKIWHEGMTYNEEPVLGDLKEAESDE